MIKSEHKWIKSPWTIAIGASAISFLLTIIGDYIKKNPILTTLWTILKGTLNLVWTVLNFDLKCWWIVTVSLLLFIFFVLRRKFLNEKVSKPDFYDYTEDNFKFFKWTWTWVFSNVRGGWIISDLAAFCPRCGTTLTPYAYSSYGCPRGDFQATSSNSDDKDDVERIILDNIRRKKSDKTYLPI